MTGPAPKRLTMDEVLHVDYCIPTWLRDEQINLAVQRNLPRLQRYDGVRTDRVAVVCYGPSLADTWQQVRDFPVVVSCSGAHRFLVERGIIPTHHVEVDPRRHKVWLIGPPTTTTEYLIASACHPAVFDHLAGANVKLWHVYADEEEAFRKLPRDEWAITGGSSVGLRCLTMARFLGFRDLHVFGMDGSARPSGTHAADHPMQPVGYSMVEYAGREYATTPSMLACAKQTLRELDVLKDCTVQFYGDGLVQAMVQDYVRTPLPFADIAVSKPALISPEYAALNTRLHRENLAYGVGGGRHAKAVAALAASLQTTSVLDYGCGKGYLGKALPFPIWEYDPAIPDRAAEPRAADLVACTDVLEHVEPDRLDFVLNDIHRCTRKVAYLVIQTGPASKTLPDGRNTHLIQEGEAWWREVLGHHFAVSRLWVVGPTLHVLAHPLVYKLKHAEDPS